MDIQTIYNFLSNLKENNNRDWFHAHKAQYDEVRNIYEQIVEQLITEISLFDKEVQGIQVSDCIFRIYRDTRFSNNKTPYKTHLGAYIASGGGRKSPRSGYYIHLEPGNSLLSGGLWCPSPEILKAVRQAIYDNIDEFLEILNNKEFKKYFGGLEGEALKTVPRLFPKDFPHADLLKFKHYIVGGIQPDSFFMDKNIAKKAAGMFRYLQPFNRFLNYTVDECIQNT